MDQNFTDTLQHFINAPDLKINSEKYPFENFEFLDERLSETEFQFPKNSVLGMQAEACFEGYIKQSNIFELLIANLQITDDKETIGELDYIVKDLIKKEIIHIELACKFYLYDVNAGVIEEEKWIGPNRKDRLSDKLGKIKMKQFPLLRKTETIKKLEELEVEIPTSQELCLKAFLFLPKKMKSNTLATNFANCVVGHWIKHKEFNEEDKTALYAIPNKKEWLLPIEKIKTSRSFSEIQKLINLQIQNKKSPLIYKKTPDKLERFFVVWW